MLFEALGKGVLDSGCSKTVAGEVWYKAYLNTLSQDDRNTVNEVSSKSVFRFGDGKESKSLMLGTIPVVIGRQRISMDVDVVEQDIPLLISKGAMKMMGMTIDFKRDVAIVNQEE